MNNQKYFFGAFVLILLDQISKLLVKGISLGEFTLGGMQLYESIPVIGNFLRITYVENPGMAFGIEVGDGKLLLTLFSIGITLFLCYMLWKADEATPTLLKFALMLILAGAVGNLIDRTFYGVLFGDAPLFHGKVVDFIDVEFFDFSLFGKTFTRWPVFNLADSCVTIGIIFFIIASLRSPAPAQQNAVVEQVPQIASQPDEER